MQKKITVFTNDPKNSKLILKIKGDVDSFAEIKPKRVKLKGVIGEEITAETSIVPTEKYPFKILKTRVENGDFVSYEITETEGRLPGWRILFQNLKKDVGTYNSTLVLETDSTVKPEIRIGIRGEIKQPHIANIFPRGVLLRGPANKLVSQKVRIVPTAKYSFEITEIKADDGENIRYEMAEDKKKKKREFVITVENQKKSSGRYFDILRVKTDSRIQPEFKITITGVIQAPRTVEN